MHRGLKIISEVVGIGIILLIVWATVKSWSFQSPVSMDIESIVTQVNQYCAGGQISDKGTCNSLLQKLQGAIEARDRGQPDVACNKLNAFVNEVQAQSGKKIDPAAAQVLINMVTPLCAPAPTVTPTAIVISPLPTPTRDLTDTFVVSINENNRPRVYQIVLMKETKKLTQPKLLNFSSDDIAEMYPSPDRQQVVVREVYGENGLLLRYFNSKTGQLKLLFGDDDPKFDQRSSFLAWSPDSQKALALSFLGSDLGDNAWLVNINDNTRQPVEIKQHRDNLMVSITSAIFSTDGSKVIYAESDCFQCFSRIWEVPVTGTERELLFEMPQRRVENLILSPDGNYIVFLLWNQDTIGELYVMKSDGSQAQRLSSAMAYYFNQYAPLCLPDSQNIIFIKVDNGNQNLYMVNITTHAITQLTHLTGEAPWRMVWSPDKTELAFITRRASGEKIMVFNLATQTLLPVDLPESLQHFNFYASFSWLD